VNGIFSQSEIPCNEIKIGMIPIGTGNDWGRMYGISKKYKNAVETLKSGKTFIQDAGKISYTDEEKEQTRYFINIAGIGYDALVAKKTNAMKTKGSGGALSYLINLFLGLIQYKFAHISIEIDGIQTFNGKIFSMCIGLCKFNGGGMMQLPNAVPDNGQFDVTLIRKASKFKVITNIKNLYDGSFVKLPEVQLFTGKVIKVKSDNVNAVLMEADGEFLGHPPFEFSIIPKSICLIAENTTFDLP
jgi:diacylglycerol kinase family enzyme